MQIYDSAERQIPVLFQLKEIYKNRSLLRILIVRDLTVRYKRSVLGVGWSLLNPILTTTVMFYVFNTVFMRGLENRETFLPYLFAGVLLSTFLLKALILLPMQFLVALGYLIKFMYAQKFLRFQAP